MKINGTVLALCFFQAAVWEANAFFVQAPKALKPTLKASPQDLTSPPNPVYTPSDAADAPTLSDRQVSQNIDAAVPVTIQGGGSLRTWSFHTDDVDRMLVSMHTTGPPEGLPLIATVDLCQGPNNTPMTMKIKSGKGRLRPFRAVIETPGDASSLFIRNIGDLEFPISARVMAATEGTSVDSGKGEGLVSVSSSIYDMPTPKRLQGGGAVASWPFENEVNKVKVWLRTDGRPLNAAVELTQGPNAVKELIELYTEDGLERPFWTIIETPGPGNMIRVWSTGNMEFPLEVAVEPFVE